MRATGRPVSLSEISELSGLHENTLRTHLHQLAEQGLVGRRTSEPAGRGRPAWLWFAVDDRASSEYAGLASALATALTRSSPDPAADSVTTGIEWGRALARGGRQGPATTPRDRRARVVELMDTLGFAPETRREADRVRLTECPLLESARAHPDVVCNVHSGLVRGALAELGDETTEVELEPFAEPGACLLRMREQAR
jgi:predicted ArsR family transcriptional regulator